MNPYAKYLKPEDHLHINICKYLNLQYRGCVIHHSPLEGKRTKFEQYLLKMLGCSAGFPDLLIFYAGKKLAIELKAGKNKATDNQKAWLAILKQYGFETAICTGFEHTKEFIDKNLK